MAYCIVKPVGCYVYTHRKATTDEVFYVGKGTAERAWDKFGRSAFWCSVVKKHGYVVVIEADGLLEFEAHARERQLIAKLRSDGAKLANMTDGGEGSLNPTAETRAKIGLAHKGRKKSLEQIEKIRLSNLGKKRSEETKKKIRERPISEETKLRMSESGKARAELSAETRSKLAEASRRKWEDPAYREKIRAGTTGKPRDAAFRKKLSDIAKARHPQSNEYRDRIRQAMKARWADPEYRAMQIAARKASAAGL